jgi:hypothetical protein
MGTTTIPAELAGRTVDCDLGPFVPRLTFLGDTGMRLQAVIGETQIDEVVEVEVTTVRPHVFAMSWTEKSGNFIVQVQDHENAVVHNYARLANGQLFCAQGNIIPVVSA